MRIIPSLLAILAVATALPLSVAAQVADELEEGARVRVWLTPVEGAAEKQHVSGALLSLSSDSLTVSIHPAAAPVTLAWAAVGRLERSRGVPSRLTSALWHGLGSAALGALEFVLLDERQGHFGSTSKAMLAGAATGAAVGIVLGAIYPRERWARVRLLRP